MSANGVAAAIALAALTHVQALHAEERWCRTERMTSCEAERCGTMQNFFSNGVGFKLTWDITSGKGFRTSCISASCDDRPSSFSFAPNRNLTGPFYGPFFGSDDWMITFPAGDNRFAETQGWYFEDKGIRTPSVSLNFGYCSPLPLEPHG